MKLTKTIFLYLNEKEFSMLTKDAERANMSRSRYIRHQIDNAKMKPTLDIDYEKYINLKSWGEVAEAVGYSKRHVQRIHDDALDLVKDVIECHS